MNYDGKITLDKVKELKKLGVKFIRRNPIGLSPEEMGRVYYVVTKTVLVDAEPEEIRKLVKSKKKELNP